MKDLPLPEVTEITPVNQWKDRLFESVTAPARETVWNQPPRQETSKHDKFRHIVTDFEFV